MSSALVHFKNRHIATGRRDTRTKPFDDALQYRNAAFIEVNDTERDCYLRRLGEKLMSNPKQFWSYVDGQRKCAGCLWDMTLGQSGAYGNTAISNPFAQQFISAYSDAGWSPDALCFDAAFIGSDSEFLDRPLTCQEVLKALKRFNGSKGAGPDYLPPCFWKASSEVQSAPLTENFNGTIASGVFPSMWKLS